MGLKEIADMICPLAQLPKPFVEMRVRKRIRRPSRSFSKRLHKNV